ncbi:MAG: serine hydrolase [Bacteroidota bacterium]
MLKKILLVVLLAALAFGVYYLWQAFPIISGFGAKNMCSCVFVSGRDKQSVLDNELSSFFLSLGSYDVNFTDSSTTASVFGTASKKAVYRKGLGCTLVSGLTEDEIKAQPYTVASNISFDADTVAWPMGDQSIDSLKPTFDEQRMKQAIDRAFEEPEPSTPRNTRAVLVVYDGQIVGEKYAEGFSADQPQLGWSMSKSVTSALIGILVKEGKLDIKERAPVSEWEEMTDPRREITLDQLLRMSSGLSWIEHYASPTAATNMLFKSSDFGQSAAQSKLSSDPDTKWYYSSGTSNIISRIVRHTVGDEQYHSFPQQALFDKLGMQTALIEPDASGTFVGSSYMWASARDWARFGLLYLNDGVWNGERILPEGWVEYSSTPTPDAPLGKYGAHFWLNKGEHYSPEKRTLVDVPNDAFWANGYEGQTVYIVPSKKLVVVRLGQTAGGNFDFNQFLSSIISALPADS